MADIVADKTKVRPLKAITIKGLAGGTITAGMAVYLDGTNGWKAADADASASSLARGVWVAPQDAATGDEGDIVVLGRVAGFAAMVPGDSHYVSGTAGSVATTAGTKVWKIGWADSATVLFVVPGNMANPA